MEDHVKRVAYQGGVGKLLPEMRPSTNWGWTKNEEGMYEPYWRRLHMYLSSPHLPWASIMQVEEGMCEEWQIQKGCTSNALPSVYEHGDGECIHKWLLCWIKQPGDMNRIMFLNTSTCFCPCTSLEDSSITTASHYHDCNSRHMTPSNSRFSIIYMNLRVLCRLNKGKNRFHGWLFDIWQSTL